MQQIDLIAPVEGYLLEIGESAANSHPELPGILVLKRYGTSAFEGVVYNPVICLILRGQKETSVGDLSVRLRPGDALLVSHDLPVISRIIEASPAEPYLALILSLDLGIIRTLHGRVVKSTDETERPRSLSVRRADPSWTEPLRRYLALAGQPRDASVIGPLILCEIHYRLLMSPIGGMLRSLTSVDSHASRIARAIARIRQDFHMPLTMTDLAGVAGMSKSSFHEHFKTVTGTSPLQYQKDLRIFEARRLLTEEGQSVSGAGFAVGYESSTQFSREYSRKFGISPGKETAVN